MQCYGLFCLLVISNSSPTAHEVLPSSGVPIARVCESPNDGNSPTTNCTFFFIFPTCHIIYADLSQFHIVFSYIEFIGVAYPFLKVRFGGYWWLPLPILQNTILVAVNQLFINSCLVIQNQRGTKTGQNHGKIKSRTLRSKYPLWNTSVSFAKVQICPLKNEGKSLFLSFTTHFPTIVLQMWLLQAILTSNSMTCEYRVLNFVLHSVGHFQKRELAIEPKICHPYCPILGFGNV